MRHHYEGADWDSTKPGWYEVTVYASHPSELYYKYSEIIVWLTKNIDKCERHCRWYARSDYVKVKFRYERDYEWFHLTWV